MTKYLVFDTENSGLFDYAAPADADGQPRLAEFAGILVNDVERGDFVWGEPVSFLVKPDGWTMTEGATAVNGLTTEYLTEHGKPVGEVLDWWTDRIKEGFVAVAFNARHDLKQMRAELHRAGKEDSFEETLNICLMRSAWKKEVGLIKADGTRKGWPSLADACRHFGIEGADDHRATSGAKNALGVFFALHSMGRLLPAEVHYAKDKPQPQAQSALPGTMDF